MEVVLAIKGTDFVMMASITATENHEMLEPKCILHPVSECSMITFAGVVDGFSQRFKKKILRQLATFEVCNGYRLTPKAAMHYSRTNLARYKCRWPNNQISIMIGGFDPTNGPELHGTDINGMAAPIPYGVLGSYPKVSDTLLQMHYKPNLHQEGAYMVLKNCADRIKNCFGNTFNFEVFVIQKGGIKRYNCHGQLPLKRTFSRRLY